jgi:hypothetical protein
MRSRVLVGALLLIGVLGVGMLAASDVGATPSQQSIVTNFMEPTLIAGAIVMGPALIVHDEALMAKGEPCTTVYRFDTSRGRQEKIVSFMCEPTHGDVVDKFTVTCRRPGFTGLRVLTEYQFAGDPEVHGVPVSNP